MTGRADATETLLDVNEAALAAGRSAETIRRWVWSGRLPARKRGRRLLISRDDLAEVIADRNGGRVRLTLAEWAVAARQALVTDEGPTRGSAADLVLADRRQRSEDRTRP